MVRNLAINLFIILIGLYFFSAIMHESPLSADNTPHKANHIFVAGEIVIKAYSDFTPDEIVSFIHSRDAEMIEKNSTSGFYRIKITEPVEKAVYSYQSYQKIEYAFPNYIFARVGNDFITLFDMEVAIHQMIPILRQRFTKAESKRELLDSMLKTEIFYRAAQDENLQDIPDVKKMVDNAVKRTLADIYEKRIHAENLSEKEMMKYYEKNKEAFYPSQQIRGKRIVVKSKSEAEDIVKLLKDGVDFAHLAKERSIESIGKQGGDFQWVDPQGIPPGIREIIFSVEKGEISNIMQTKAGYTIIKVEDKRTAKDIPFSEVKNQIQNRLKSLKKKEAIEIKRKELEEKYQVKTNHQFLSNIKVDTIEKIDLQDKDNFQMLREVIKKAIERPH